MRTDYYCFLNSSTSIRYVSAIGNWAHLSIFPRNINDIKSVCKFALPKCRTYISDNVSFCCYSSYLLIEFYFIVNFVYFFLSTPYTYLQLTWLNIYNDTKFFYTTELHKRSYTRTCVVGCMEKKNDTYYFSKRPAAFHWTKM